MRRQAVSVTNVSTPNSAEGAVATINMPLIGADPSDEPAQGAVVDALVNITPGVGATAVVLRCRRGSVSGALVGASQTVALGAGNAGSVPFQVFDSNPSGGTYVLTVQQTGGTGAGTVNVAVVTATAA